MRKCRQMLVDSSMDLGTQVMNLAFASLNTLEGQISTETLVLS